MEKLPQPANNSRKKTIGVIIFFALAVIGAATVYLYIQYKESHITTDDAYVDGRIHVIASRVPGAVKAVYVADNQSVKKGDVLAEIDDSDYGVKLREAEAALNAEKSKLNESATKGDVAREQLSEIWYRVESAGANLALQEANLRQAELDIKRAENLFRKDALSKERYERAKTGYDVSISQVKMAKEQVKQAEASLETQKAVIRQADSGLAAQSSLVKQREAVLKAAELNRSYTKIYAPADGRITKKSVETGNQISAGQPLMAVVPLDDVWITANYKETQLEKVRVGQKVKIRVDTYPGRVFNGRVESVMAGTGAVFSLFPPENATGSYVKVVQRIPVKITLDKDTDKEHVLRVGMSVVPMILVEK